MMSGVQHQYIKPQYSLGKCCIIPNFQLLPVAYPVCAVESDLLFFFFKSNHLPYDLNKMKQIGFPPLYSIVHGIQHVPLDNRT